MPTLGELFDLAVRHHQNGSLSQAEALYRQVLQADPGHADSLHLLGVLAHQCGHHEAAIALIRQAIAVRPAAIFYFNLGTVHQAHGQLADAVDCYRETLRLDPNHAGACNNMGTALAALGRLAEAGEAYRQGLRISPHHADGYYNLGLALVKQGELAEAVVCFREATRLNPNHADAHNDLGAALRDQGEVAQATLAYREAVRANPGHARAYCNLGSALAEQGNLAQAVDYYQQALCIDPNSADTCNKLGSALEKLGRAAEAEVHYRQALRINPMDGGALNNLGNVMKVQGHADQAIACYRQALAIDRNFVDAHINLGNALKDLGHADDAVACYREALRVDPNHADALNNLGGALSNQGNVDEAIAFYRQALAVNPDHTDALSNLGKALERRGHLADAVELYRRALCAKRTADAFLSLGNALKQEGELAEAFECVDEALRIDPGNRVALLSRSLLRLLHGDFADAWANFEHRWAHPDAVTRNFQGPVWDGSPREGKTLLVYSEQGLGDEIQFLRYLPMVRRRAGRVVFECHAQLFKLLSVGVAGADEITPMGSPTPPYDAHVPLLSLPGLFSSTLETIPRSVPYLAATADLEAYWRNELSSVAGFKIGICWQGNPKNHSDAYRSIPLKYFETLARIEGVRLVSLQKGPAAEQLADRGTGGDGASGISPIIDFGDRLDAEGAFLDTAAILKNVDLVVTVDTAIAHLAGAMGVPVWVALPLVPDWRWLLDREDSPWYPTMLLFRQRRFGDWEDVFERIALALGGLTEAYF